jgi:hypothetical protein
VDDPDRETVTCDGSQEITLTDFVPAKILQQNFFVLAHGLGNSMQLLSSQSKQVL